MDLKDLEYRLKSIRIPVQAFEINTEYDTEVYRIVKKDGKWEIYYSERGNKNSLKIFSNENDACEYFYQWLSNSISQFNL